MFGELQSNLERQSEKISESKQLKTIINKNISTIKSLIFEKSARKINFNLY